MIDVAVVENFIKHEIVGHALNVPNAVMRSVPLQPVPHQLVISLVIGLCSCSLLDGDSGGQAFSASGTNAAIVKLELLQPAIPTVAHRMTESNGTFIPNLV